MEDVVAYYFEESYLVEDAYYFEDAYLDDVVASYYFEDAYLDEDDVASYYFEESNFVVEMKSIHLILSLHTFQLDFDFELLINKVQYLFQSQMIESLFLQFHYQYKLNLYLIFQTNYFLELYLIIF